VNEKAGGATARSAAPVRRGAVAFIFVTILLDMLALGVIMPILPKLIESFVGNDTAHAARIFGLFGTSMGADAIRVLAAPGRAVGSLRAPAGGAAVEFGLAADYVLMALAPSFDVLFVGRVISGTTSASISTAFAYIADITPPERRAAIFGKSVRPSAPASSWVRRWVVCSAISIRGCRSGASAALKLRQCALRSLDPAGIVGRRTNARRSAGPAPIRRERCVCCAPTRGWPRCRWSTSSHRSRMSYCRRPSCSTRPIVMAGIPRLSD